MLRHSHEPQSGNECDAVSGVSRRRLLIGGSAAVAGAVLAACGGSRGRPATQSPQQPLGSPAARAPVTIEYFAGLNERQLGNYQTLLVDAFERARPPLKLAVIAQGGTEKLLALMSAGTPPDVSSSAKPKEYLTKQVHDITRYVQRDKYDTLVFPKETFESTCTWRGRIINLPNEYGGTWPVMPYNRDLFRRAGVPEPPAKWGDPAWNADSYLQAMQKLTRVDADGRPASFGMNQPNMRMTVVFWPWLWRTAWITDDLAIVTCDSAPMIEAYEYLTSLSARRRVMATDSMLRESFGDPNAEKAFLKGQLAMFSSAGANRIITVGQAVREQSLPISYAPLPIFKTVRAAQHLNGNGIVVGAGHPEEAFTFLKWSADTPNWGISRGNPPPRIEHFDLWVKEVYGAVAAEIRIDVYRQSLQHSAKRDPIENLPTFDQMQQGLITPAFNRLWAGEASVAATLKELKAPLQAFVPKELPN